MAWPRFGLPFPQAGNGRINVTWDAESRLLNAVIEFAKRPRLARLHAPTARASESKAEAYLATLTEAYGILAPAALLQTMPSVDALVLDPSALIALAGGDERARAVLARAVATSANILVPATALLDVRAGTIAHAIGTIAAVDAGIAREAGRLMARARLTMPLDALTVALAARQRSAALLTSDRIAIAALVRAADHPALHLVTLA